MEFSDSAKAAASRRTARTASDARQPCRECRRRKGKCDSQRPVCSVCQRYKRHCLYDKDSRSSLTRKHLTEVEDRLERAEALLRQLLTESQLTQLLEGHSSNVEDILRSLRKPSETENTFPNAGYHQNMPVPSWSQQTGFAASQNTAAAPQLHDVPSLITPTSLSPAFTDNTPAPFESLPSPEDDFEWDERDLAWNAPAGGGNTSVIDGIQGDAQKIMDGMATLSAGDSNSGYLGSVSGAALLRTIWMSSSNEPSNDSDARNARRKSLQHIFSKNSTDEPAASPWLRTQPNLTRIVVDTLIDAYFTLYHPTFPILHEATFREQYAQLNTHPGGSTWHILANIVVSLGSFVLSDCTDDTDITIFAAVKGQLSVSALETGSLGLVQAFGLAANYLQKRNKPNSGYNYGGVALRLAIGLGLHKEFDGWQAAPLKMEIRRRVWWALCILDVGATITYGRPLNWPQVGVETSFPLNIHEQSLTSSSVSLPPEVEEATIYAYIYTQSAYHLHTMPIYNRLISIPFPSAEELTSLDDNIIGGWLGSLPHYYRDDDSLLLDQTHSLGHSISRWRFRNLRIIMYRPFLIRWALHMGTSSVASFSQAETLAIGRCFDAAKESINLIATFWRSCTPTRLTAWYVLYFMFQASLIPVHCLRRNPLHTNAADWRSQIHTTLEVVDSMKELNAGSSKCRDVINRLCGRGLNVRSEETRASEAVENQGEFVQSPAYGDNGVPNWMTEIDTAIYEYDASCDRITNASMGNADWSVVGMQDWDWGLLL